MLASARVERRASLIERLRGSRHLRFSSNEPCFGSRDGLLRAGHFLRRALLLRAERRLRLQFLLRELFARLLGRAQLLLGLAAADGRELRCSNRQGVSLRLECLGRLVLRELCGLLRLGQLVLRRFLLPAGGRGQLFDLRLPTLAQLGERAGENLLLGGSEERLHPRQFFGVDREAAPLLLELLGLRSQALRFPSQALQLLLLHGDGLALLRRLLRQRRQRRERLSLRPLQRWRSAHQPLGAQLLHLPARFGRTCGHLDLDVLADRQLDGPLRLDHSLRGKLCGLFAVGRCFHHRLPARPH